MERSFLVRRVISHFHNITLGKVDRSWPSETNCLNFKDFATDREGTLMPFSCQQSVFVAFVTDHPLSD